MVFLHSLVSTHAPFLIRLIAKKKVGSQYAMATPFTIEKWQDLHNFELWSSY